MAVQMIVTDMNGTLLNNVQEFDKRRLERQLTKMKAAGIWFVVCSGNQFAHLKRLFFGMTTDNVIFVAENGASIYQQGQEIFDGAIAANRLQDFLQHDWQLPLLKAARVILVGAQGAYTLKGAPKRLVAVARQFYDQLEEVTDLTQVTDTIKKISLSWDEGAPKSIVPELNQLFKNSLVAQDSGYGVIDLIRNNIGKLPAVQFLQQRFKVANADVVAFGDGANDLAMLQAVGNGYAMRNASTTVKQAAKFVTTKDNEHSGVLATIEQLLAL
ncbi:Cof-type HAD-IIB family hydrolase [Loigolactobacillus backii]|uniref:Cof-type HAD-IIB family hydrolase n=1 Tax=Loigolactobacillus backii TaxID=375175 RepID=UPI0007F0AEDB|nr:Cof-type HAD-IIB family hydrolase [Loigolactobacillus backii]ANK67770.1 hypothetical protein AYR55_08775 [Loigolactobacillus backii]OLF70472.1 hypothetical protein ACX53_02370 [Loigolactobacillus backii]PIO87005.1 hypothetical protein B8A32_07565 [Loigolactobacillus backii]